ncbi:ATP-binding protein [Streptomyces sp. NPDC056437]|uniref:ATP-binding protein n=1 Tax=Streptomyces sp. NPDC056437 TaxID=3345816 RepID=UPI003695641A
MQANERPVVRRWSRHPASVGGARSELSKALANWCLNAVEDAALVVLSELVTNAVRHARVSPGREIETRYVREANGVRIEVHDAADERPAARVPGESGGWGLGLVDELSDRWGVDDRAGVGKSVWAVVTARTGKEARWLG